MSIEKRDIVTVLTPSGEYVGRFEEEKDGKVTLYKPKMLVKEGTNVGFSQGICLSAEEESDYASFYSGSMILMTLSSKTFADGWKQSTDTVQFAGV